MRIAARDQRLSAMENDFEPLLIKCLKECANRRWGLFGQDQQPESAAVPRQRISVLLKGGDRRSIGRSNFVVKLVLRAPKRFAELIKCLWSDDPIVRMRAADAAEKISAAQPELLKPYKAELLGLLAETEQIEIRRHLAQMIPRLPLTQEERRRATEAFQLYLEDRSSIVRIKLKCLRRTS